LVWEGGFCVVRNNPVVLTFEALFICAWDLFDADKYDEVCT
jgi:hypothetical protein